MYIWNIRALKQELMAGKPKEAPLFGYFYAILVVDLAILYSYWLLPMSNISIWTYVGAVVTPGITLVGTYIAWHQNGRSAGRDFLGRYFPLMWVLGVRFCVMPLAVILPIVFVGGIVAGLTGFGNGGEIPALTEPMALVLGWTWLVVFYWRLAVHMREIATTSG